VSGYVPRHRSLLYNCHAIRGGLDNVAPLPPLEKHTHFSTVVSNKGGYTLLEQGTSPKDKSSQDTKCNLKCFCCSLVTSARHDQAPRYRVIRAHESPLSGHSARVGPRLAIEVVLEEIYK
jgi:hypothetical protein